MSEWWREQGFETYDEWIDDYLERFGFGATRSQKLGRWWRLNWPSVLALLVMVSAIGILLVVSR